MAQSVRQQKKLPIASSAPPSHCQAHSWLLSGLGLIALVALVFGRLVNAELTNYDDNFYVTFNPHVQSGLSLESTSWAFSSYYAANWHPLTWLSLQLDQTLFGPKPAGFHLTNIVLHGTNAILLFFILRRMTGALWRSWFVAALFALHPLHVESVAWVAERKDVLSGLFWMLTLWAYMLYVEKPGIIRYGALISVFGLGLLTKPMLVTLPMVLLLLDYWPLKRSFSKVLLLEKAPLVILVGVSSLITFQAQAAGGALKSLEWIPFPVRLANSLYTYVAYLFQTLWPIDLAVFYAHEFPTWNDWRVIGAAGLLVFLTFSVVYLGKTRPYLPVGWFWYLGTLVPVIGLIQVGIQGRADRYTYLPLIGVFILIVWGCGDLASKPQLKKTVVVAGVGAILICCVLSFLQTGIWQNSVTLWQHALAVAKEHASIHQSLGIALNESSRPEEALPHLKKALDLDPSFADHHYNYGLAIQRDRPAQAAQEFAITVRINPNHLKAHECLARLLGRENKQDEAIHELLEILRLDPHEAQAHISLGLTYMKRFEMVEAQQHFQEALTLQPRNPEVQNYLGLTFAWQQEYETAEGHYRKALALNDRYPEALVNLGTSLAHQGKWKEARYYLERAVKLEPRAVGFHCQLALVLNELGDSAGAAKAYETASRLKPDWPQAACDLAWKLATHSDAKNRSAGDALFLAQEACRATASQPNAKYLDVLAAAQANMGRFEEAIATIKKALALNSLETTSDQVAAMQARLRQYQGHQPYREPSAKTQ
jgi:protein O-mannosyl-transferase